MGEFTWNYAGGREMLNMPGMVAAMRGRGEAVLAVAVAISPFGDERAGHYVASFGIESGTNGGIHHDRAYCEIFNDHDDAMEIEFGTSDTPEFAPLRKALDAAG